MNKNKPDKRSPSMKRPRYDPNPSMEELFKKLKTRADEAEKEWERRLKLDMPLTDNMKDAVEVMYTIATGPERVKDIEQAGSIRTCRSCVVLEATKEMVEPFDSLNMMTKEKIWNKLHERVREHYAPFRVLFQRQTCVTNAKFTVKW